MGMSNDNDSRERDFFEEFINQSNLFDVPLRERYFTWYRPNGTCKSRLDRVLINEEWLEKWPGVMLKGLDKSLSDHCPILLYLNCKDWGPRPFRFLNIWTSHPNFLEFVESRWSTYAVEGWAGFVLKEKLKLLRADLKTWNSEVFGDIDTSINLKKTRIGEIDRIDDVFGLVEDEVVERKKIAAELLRDQLWKERLLQQKTKARWIREGDMNSRFYHYWINKRFKVNKIAGLLVGNRWIEGVDEVKQEVHNHFRRQFSAMSNERPYLPEEFGQKKLDEADNLFLVAPFTEDEIKQAVWDCESSRSPGPDGFSFEFIKKCWCLLKKDFLKLMEEFHSHGKIFKGLNPSFITLIPKKEGAQSLQEFRPISLIGCVYKVISKVLAKRLSKVLEGVISESQSAFIGGRQILDGIVILNETIHEAKLRKKKCFIFKIDFEKAYDSVIWDFLDDMMTVLNFDPKWRLWIKACVSSASASVLVNGSPSAEFKLEKGLRQGDPLSPFLYLVVAEGLNLLIKRAINRGLLEAVEIGSEKIPISHLQYADDTIFMCPDKGENIGSIKWVLRIFELLLSGLKVNFSKSNLYGINIDAIRLREKADLLGCEVGMGPINYLGLKVGVNHRNSSSWTTIVQRIRNRIETWSGKHISLAGRVTLIQAVLSALPTYCLSF